MRVPGKLDPGLDGGDWSSSIGRSAADLHPSPPRFTAQGEEHALVKNSDSPARVFGLVRLQIETDDL